MQAVAEITRGRLGMTAVVGEGRRLLGVFTDGDLRRAVQRGVDFARARIDELMTREPKTVRADALAAEAAQLMERHKVSQVLVVDEAGGLLGALNTHDLLRAKVI
jgi:arabinose-5-phosphate isomerase